MQQIREYKKDINYKYEIYYFAIGYIIIYLVLKEMLSSIYYFVFA